uniref:Ubiquinone biosynthesis O-methyltransferase n=1 Tax=Candidatus Aschnera chinzeii TaxID=1485666 RepID=A0AAT9G4K7_9ENTR|nr:MAG: bifunctional 3-demethylubiquinone 3-O-methyltransferase/2-octaprenyl-6-hydroxy phenol methylase [Candidatus Aschnera chinzeii]
MYNKKKILCENFEYNEVNKFNLCSMSWWDKENGIAKYLHLMNPLRLHYIMNNSDGIYGKQILDIGCGGGILSESMAKEGGCVTGIDISNNLLTLAKHHALKNNLHIQYVCDTVENHVNKFHNYYDIVTCMEVIEHVQDPISLVKSCAKLLNFGGHLFISTINRNKKSWLFAIFLAEYILHMLPKGTHDIKKFIKPAELLDWMDNTSLQAFNIVGMQYNPVLHKFFLSENIDINYILHAINF